MVYDVYMNLRQTSYKGIAYSLIARQRDAYRYWLALLLMSALMFQGVLSAAHSYVHLKTFEFRSPLTEFHPVARGTNVPRAPGAPAQDNPDDEVSCSICLALLMGGTFVPSQLSVLAPVHAAEGITISLVIPVVISKTRYSSARPRAPPQFD